MITRKLSHEMTMDNIRKGILFALEYNENQECWHFNDGSDVLYKAEWYPVCLMVRREDASKFCDYIESKYQGKKGLKFMTVLKEFTNYLDKNISQ